MTADFARPVWLRAGALALAVAVHAALAAFFVARGVAPPRDPPEIVISLEAAPDAPPPPSPTPVETPTPEPSTTPTPEPTATPMREPAETSTPEPTVTPTPDPVVTPTPVPVVIPKPRPPPPSPRPSPKPTPAPSPRPSATPRPKPTPKPTPEDRTNDDAERRKAHEDSRKAKPQPAPDAAASGADLAAYGATIYGEIARRKPAGGGASGSVVVVFTVGASGRIVSQSLAKSSGDAELDARVTTMMQSVQAPPPPGGKFTGRITIRFSGS